MPHESPSPSQGEGWGEGGSEASDMTQTSNSAPQIMPAVSHRGAGRGEGGHVVESEHITMRRIHPEIRQRARELRQPQTQAEQILWRCLRGAQMEGLKFRRQHPMGRFIVDFYCAAEKLVIEVDGDSHADQVEYDQARTDWLESQGCPVCCAFQITR